MEKEAGCPATADFVVHFAIPSIRFWDFKPREVHRSWHILGDAVALHLITHTILHRSLTSKCY